MGRAGATVEQDERRTDALLLDVKPRVTYVDALPPEVAVEAVHRRDRNELALDLHT